MIDNRNIPQGVQRELEQQESEETLLVFLTIYNSKLHDPIRVVSDPENFILDGNEYIGYEFYLKLLNDGDGPPKATLTIQNVDNRIGQSVLETDDPIGIDIEIISASEFDTTQKPRTEISNPSVRVYRAKYLRLTDVTGNLIQITGTIRSWDYSQESWPAMKATEDRLPALFWS